MQLDRIKQEAKRNTDRIGVTHEITHPWAAITVYDDSDVTLALGGFSLAVGSDTLVTKNGNTLHATIKYRLYAYDLYDFTKERQWDVLDPESMIKTGFDADMRQLEEAGWARSFKARGDSQVTGDYYWSGDL
ncbi:hypothetical protein [Nocardia huaxiensis]|uniref:hypothetical protein n=1 Tax=Nocardia huaxiensis TaxID=2755382 RepID=UPI001E364884|nr:hypothetical protein [Nocardia huaxiensis]UFS96999.1 hypothetical protein LPY97_03430 [Nocardia huaxiensis]